MRENTILSHGFYDGLRKFSTVCGNVRAVSASSQNTLCVRTGICQNAMQKRNRLSALPCISQKNMASLLQHRLYNEVAIEYGVKSTVCPSTLTGSFEDNRAAKRKQGRNTYEQCRQELGDSVVIVVHRTVGRINIAPSPKLTSFHPMPQKQC